MSDKCIKCTSELLSYTDESNDLIFQYCPECDTIEIRALYNAENENISELNKVANNNGKIPDSVFDNLKLNNVLEILRALNGDKSISEIISKINYNVEEKSANEMIISILLRNYSVKTQFDLANLIELVLPFDNSYNKIRGNFERNYGLSNNRREEKDIFLVYDLSDLKSAQIIKGLIDDRGYSYATLYESFFSKELATAKVKEILYNNLLRYKTILYVNSNSTLLKPTLMNDVLQSIKESDLSKLDVEYSKFSKYYKKFKVLCGVEESNSQLIKEIFDGCPIVCFEKEAIKLINENLKEYNSEKDDIKAILPGEKGELFKQLLFIGKYCEIFSEESEYNRFKEFKEQYFSKFENGEKIIFGNIFDALSMICENKKSMKPHLIAFGKLFLGTLSSDEDKLLKYIFDMFYAMQRRIDSISPKCWNIIYDFFHKCSKKNASFKKSVSFRMNRLNKNEKQTVKIRYENLTYVIYGIIAFVLIMVGLTFFSTNDALQFTIMIVASVIVLMAFNVFSAQHSKKIKWQYGATERGGQVGRFLKIKTFEMLLADILVAVLFTCNLFLGIANVKYQYSYSGFNCTINNTLSNEFPLSILGRPVKKISLRAIADVGSNEYIYIKSTIPPSITNRDSNKISDVIGDKTFIRVDQNSKNNYMNTNDYYDVKNKLVGTNENALIFNGFKGEYSYFIDGDTFDVNTADAKQHNGYTFCGWYTDSSFASQPLKTIPIEKDKVVRNFYGKYDLINYSIIYELNGGTISNETKTYNIESEKVKLVEPVKNGYVFLDWIDGKGKIVKENYFFNKYNDQKIQAKWIKRFLYYNLESDHLLNSKTLTLEYNKDKGKYEVIPAHKEILNN